jgi:hypothetical protein
VLQHPEGSATVTDLPGGERRVSVSPRDPALFTRVRGCTTRYPDDLIEAVLAVKGIGALCDEIEREELPGVKARLRDAFRVLQRLTGVSFTPYLSFAIEKARRP